MDRPTSNITLDTVRYLIWYRTALCFVTIVTFVCCILPWSAIANDKQEGCFDKDRFCFVLTRDNQKSERFNVYVERRIAHPVALTLYSSSLFTADKAKKRHANAFLNTDAPAHLGYVNQPRTFWRNMRVKWTVGNINATHNAEYIYRSPLQPAHKYRIVQGFNGSFSHRGASRYALDFAAPVGTPIFAAREGIVIDVKEDGQKGGPSSNFARHANYVVILHNDGTTGEYYHLMYNGVAVSRGQTAQQGQLIGYTGNTGFSSLPHLHFGVYVAKYHGQYQSVPFTLDNQ